VALLTVVEDRDYGAGIEYLRGVLRGFPASLHSGPQVLEDVQKRPGAALHVLKLYVQRLKRLQARACGVKELREGASKGCGGHVSRWQARVREFYEDAGDVLKFDTSRAGDGTHDPQALTQLGGGL